MDKTKIGSQVLNVDTTDSTNDFMSSYIREKNANEGTVVFALYQKFGRGQRTNSWFSSKGENILMSILLYPHFLAVDKQFMLSKAISLGVYDFLSKYTDNIKIKWPNDIYYGNHKIAGILIENTLTGNKISNCIAGIGININEQHFPGDLPNPISLSMILQKQFELKKLRTEIMFYIENRYNLMKSGNINQIDNEYLDKLYLLNLNHLFTVRGEKINGKIMGVSEIGRLQVLTEHNETQEYDFKEIVY